jgi:hypothetical protein
MKKLTKWGDWTIAEDENGKKTFSLPTTSVRAIVNLRFEKSEGEAENPVVVPAQQSHESLEGDNDAQKNKQGTQHQKNPAL